MDLDSKNHFNFHQTFYISKPVVVSGAAAYVFVNVDCKTRQGSV